MTRRTLELPEDLDRRLRLAAQGQGIRPSRLIIQALERSFDPERRILDAPASRSGIPALQQQTKEVRRALGDPVMVIDMAGTPPSPAATTNGGERLISTEAFPRLTPSLSDAIVAEREDSR